MSAIRLLFDEDFNGRVIRGLRRRMVALDTLTAAEASLLGAPDPEVLAWAASDSRLLVSHDHNTMRAYADDRLRANLDMAGLLLVRQDYPLGQAIDDLALIGEATTGEEWRSLRVSPNHPGVSACAHGA